MFKPLKSPWLVYTLVVVASTLSAGYVHAQASGPSDILGVWEADNGNLKFEMFDAGGTFAARVIYGNRLVEADGKTFKKDTLNPDPNLRSRSLEGTVFVSNLKWNAEEKRWEGGSLYDASSGRTVSARVALVNTKMELRGYVGAPMFGQTVVLHRIPKP